jgi:ABC-type multidrug transport system fused ATPase/permease subunit
LKKIFQNTIAVLTAAEKKRYYLLLLLDIIINILDILFLAALVWIIHFYIQPGKHSAIGWLPNWMNDQTSPALIAVFVCLFAVKNIMAFLVSKAQYRFNATVAIRISLNNLQSYQQGPFSEFTQTDSSVHLRKIAFQPFEFCQHLLTGTQQVITQSFLVSATIIAVLIFNAKIFLLLLLILMPPVIIIFFYIKKKLSNSKKQIQSGNERSFQYLLDALKAYVESNVNGRNEFFQERFLTPRTAFSRHLFDTLAWQSLPGRMIEIVALLGLFILIAIAGWTGNANANTLVMIGAFMAAAYKIIPGIVKIINITGQIKAYEFASGDLVQQIKKEQKASEVIENIQSISMKDISFNYGLMPVLKNINFSVQRGDFAAMSGASGKGKTTTLNLLLGFLSPSSGHININGNKKDAIQLKSCWPRIAYMPQQTFLINDSILKNIALSTNDVDEASLKKAMTISGLNNMLESFPRGLDTIITENGKNISGGQQQRIAIARALYKDADVILLDEPFNELDEVSIILIVTHLRELAATGKIILMISHQSKWLQFCNKTISLDEG